MASYVGFARAVRYLVVAVLLGSTCLLGGSGSGAQASALAGQFSPLTSVNLCGAVSAYTPATLLTTGSVTIGGQTLVIAKGAVLTGVAVLLGSNLCLSAQLNASGQIQSGTFSLDVGASISVCGVVTAYVAATALTTGLLTIGGQALVLAPGATLSGAPISVGSNLCLQASTNALAQITSGTVSVNTQTTVTVCGTVTSYTAATGSAPGSITIGGQTFPIARGTTLSGSVSVGADASATFTLDSTGTVVGGSVIPGGCATNTSVPTATNTIVPTETSTAVPTLTSTDVASPGATATSTDTGSNPTATSTDTAASPTATSTGGATATATSTGGVTATATATAGGATLTPTTGPGGGHGPTVTPGPTSTGGGPMPTSTSSGGPGATPTPTQTGSGGQATPVPPTAGPQATATAAPTSTGGNGPATNTPTLTEYLLPGTVSGTQRGRGPWQFARDPHGNVWFTEYMAGGLGEILAGTHTLHEYRLHGPRTYPMGLTSDHAGHIWVVERAGNRIDRLVLSKGHATLTSWQLPHAYSGPQEIASGTRGGFWITERASRVAFFTPATSKLSEYTLSRGLQPYGITVNSHGPTFVNENANLQSWATVTSSGRLQLRVKGLPWRASDPTLLAPTSSGSYVAMPMADGFARLRRPTQVSVTLRPSIVTLKAVSQPRSLGSTRLTPFGSGVKVVTRTAKRTSHNGSVLWRLPPHPGRPFDVKVDPRGKQVWLSEQRVSIVAATALKSHRITDYVMSRKNAGLRGILTTRRSSGTRVWIAEFYANRIGLLDTP